MCKQVDAPGSFTRFCVLHFLDTSTFCESSSLKPVSASIRTFAQRSKPVRHCSKLGVVLFQTREKSSSVRAVSKHRVKDVECGMAKKRFLDGCGLRMVGY